MTAVHRRRSDDPLAPAAGILFAALIGTAIWALIAWTVWA